MANTRLERQARGRAGRQGDPGSSQFFVSLEDEVVTQMFAEKTDKILEGNRTVSPRTVRRLVDRSQRIVSEQSVSSREQAVRYDQILRRQREIMYGARNRLLDGDSISEEELRSIVHRNLKRFVDAHPRPSQGELNRYVLDNLTYELDEEELSLLDAEGPSQLYARLCAFADRLLDRKSASFADRGAFEGFLRACMLKAIDEGWIEEVDYLQQLQYAITSRGTAQRNPIYEYSREAYQSFDEMKTAMMERIARNFYLAEPQVGRGGAQTILFP